MILSDCMFCCSPVWFIAVTSDKNGKAVGVEGERYFRFYRLNYKRNNC